MIEQTGGYLDWLAGTIDEGVRRLPAAFVERQRGYLGDAQRPDGGFAGVSGGSDLYYVSFALRAAEPLGMCGCFWRRTDAFLADRMARRRPSDIVEWFSALHAAHLIARHGGGEARSAQDLRGPAQQALERCRTPDGGYVRTVDASPAESSLYATFLAALSWALVDRPMPDTAGAGDYVLRCRRDDGGFADNPKGALSGGTNPTAAAVALLGLCGGLDAAVARGARDVLSGMQDASGGVRAHGRAPAADLLSTFTALVALTQLQSIDALRRADVARYVRATMAPGGGFAATPGIGEADVEYTYYGLGALGLLNRAAFASRACACACSTGCDSPSQRSRSGRTDGPAAEER